MEAALIIPVEGHELLEKHRLLWDPEIKEFPLAHMKLMSFVVESEERIASLLSTIRFSCRLVNSFKVDINTWTPEMNRYGYTVFMAPSITDRVKALFKFLFNDFPWSVSKNIPQEFRPKIRVGECNQEEYKTEFLSKFGPFSFDVNSISLVTKHNGIFKVRANIPLAPAVLKGVSFGSTPSSATASSVSSECGDFKASSTDLKEILPIASVPQHTEKKNVNSEAPFSNESDEIFHSPKNEKKIGEKSSSKPSSKRRLSETVNVLKPGKYMVKRKCRVRKREEMESSFVKDLPSETVVKVTVIRNNRARIVEPVKGWVSVTFLFGKLVRAKSVPKKNPTKNKSQMLIEIVPPTVMYRKLPAGNYGLRNGRHSRRCKELETALQHAGLHPTKVILVRKRDEDGINIESFAFAEFKTHEDGVKALKTQIKLRDQVYRKEKPQKRNLKDQLSPFSSVWSLKYKHSQQYKKNRS